MKAETIHGIVHAMLDAEHELGVHFDTDFTIDVLRYCIRKLERIGKDEDYLPLLYRCELESHLAMREINKMSEAIYRERKGGERYVLDVLPNAMPPTVSQCRGTPASLQVQAL